MNFSPRIRKPRITFPTSSSRRKKNSSPVKEEKNQPPFLASQKKCYIQDLLIPLLTAYVYSAQIGMNVMGGSKKKKVICYLFYGSCKAEVQSNPTGISYQETEKSLKNNTEIM